MGRTRANRLDFSNKTSKEPRDATTAVLFGLCSLLPASSGSGPKADGVKLQRDGPKEQQLWRADGVERSAVL